MGLAAMKWTICGVTAAAMLSATMPSYALTPPPDTLPGADQIRVMCTVTEQRTSNNCRFTTAIIAEKARLRAGAILGYLDAHPVPIPGGSPGSDVDILIRLNVTARPGQTGYTVMAPEGVTTPISGSYVDDPVWIQSPLDQWAAWFMPDRAMRMDVTGEARVLCKVTATGGLVDCWSQDEEPEGFGFAQAALKILTRAQMQPRTASGQAVAERPFAITINFDPNAGARSAARAPSERPGIAAFRTALDPANGPPFRRSIFREAPAKWKFLGPVGGYFPDRAWRMGIGGAAVIQCSIKSTGKLTFCKVLADAPLNFGFGEASLKMAEDSYLSAAPIPGGSDGEVGRIVVEFINHNPHPG